MAKIPRRVQDPNDPQELARAINDLILAIDGSLSFGEPNSFSRTDGTIITALAGSSAAEHNGSISNLDLSWAEINLTAPADLGAAKTLHHNLYLNEPNYSVPTAGAPNVRWLVAGWQAFNHTPAATDYVTAYLNRGDTVNPNSIQLRFGSNIVLGGAGSVSLRVTILFLKSSL